MGYKFKLEKTEKKCSKCGLVKPHTEYYYSYKKMVDGINKRYLQGPCKVCQRISMEIYRRMVGHKPNTQSKIKSNIKIEYWNTLITLLDGTQIKIVNGCSREEEIALVRNGFIHIINYDGREIKKQS